MNPTAGAFLADEEPSENRTKINVLLVEDEESHIELIQRSFESRGNLIRMKVARSLREARSTLGDQLPDLAIIDLKLPDGDGTELLQAEGETSQYPAVIMTSHGDETVAVETMKAGAQHYVVKSPQTLLEMPSIAEGALREWGYIMERRRAEEALADSEEHFRSLIENALDIITVIEEDGTIHYASPSMKRVLGYSPEERVGSNFYALIHPEDRPGVIGKLLEVSGEPDTTQLLDFRHLHQGGSLRHLEAVCSTHLRDDGSRRAVINSRDVTDRRQAEESKLKLEKQLRHSQKWEVIGSLAGGIADEFNNMLTPILGYASLSLREAPPGSKIQKGLEHILTAANRSRELAEQLLYFSRQAEPQRLQIRLQDVIDEAVKLLRASLPSTIEIRQSVETEQDTVLADPDQLHHVLMNLCTNAHQAMGQQGGILDISLTMVEVDAAFLEQHSKPQAEGTYARLSVSDTGHGMDRKTQERVLEPFFTTKGEGERTGLGLSVTHGIVVSHGGDLAVDSEPEKGTTVHVYLPAASSEQGSEEAEN